MGCACAKNVVEETAFYRKPPRDYIQPSKDLIEVCGFFIFKYEKSFQKFYINFYKNGHATLHMHENAPIIFLMSLKKYEFQPEFKLVPKQSMK